MVVTINGLVVDNSYASAMKDTIQPASGLTPASASPVLKTKIKMTLPGFPETLARADFTVNATSTTDSTYVRYLNVVEVDDDAKELTCMFGGAKSGEFQITIRHKSYGLVDTEGMILDVSARVTSYSPQVGSIYGGTLLTITGENFGTVATDNPVRLSPGGSKDATECYVITTSANEITCRVDPTLYLQPKTDGTETMIVFLKTSEEAKCSTGVCDWTFTSTLPEITGAITAEFDVSAGTEGWNVIFAGTGFTGTTETT
jgi:hypothetical protein